MSPFMIVLLGLGAALLVLASTLLWELIKARRAKKAGTAPWCDCGLYPTVHHPGWHGFK